MCLTEPHAGTDVGAAKTTATQATPTAPTTSAAPRSSSPAATTTWPRTSSTWCSRAIDGAPAGHQGPVAVHRAQAPRQRRTAALGEVERRQRRLASSTRWASTARRPACSTSARTTAASASSCGTVENQGMPQMFQMMNGARIAVGHPGPRRRRRRVPQRARVRARSASRARASSSWKDPTAPRVPIIEHPDVRRMLLDMKARVEGIRALVVKLDHPPRPGRACSQGKDDEKAALPPGPGRPAHAAGQGVRLGPGVPASAATAIQTYGGAGYLKDHPVEQYCRDSKIFSIYEGTNHIQAMDLVGPQAQQAGGRTSWTSWARSARSCEAHAAHPRFAAAVAELGRPSRPWAGHSARLMEWGQAGKSPCRR